LISLLQSIRQEDRSERERWAQAATSVLLAKCLRQNLANQLIIGAAWLLWVAWLLGSLCSLRYLWTIGPKFQLFAGVKLRRTPQSMLLWRMQHSLADSGFQEGACAVTPKAHAIQLELILDFRKYYLFLRLPPGRDFLLHCMLILGICSDVVVGR
jgi:hypothetical protein